MPGVIVSLLQEIEDMFSKDILSGLPPLREIEQQIHPVCGAAIPN
jgi:hypothetical protein